MNNIFILGSSGYIGTHLYNFMKLYTNFNVLSSGRSNADVYADLEGSVDKLVYATVEDDVVVLLSSISSPDICANQPDIAYKVNVTATLELIKRLTQKGVKVIFSSTDIVFGKSKSKVIDNSRLMPFGVYGKMKAKVEQEVINNSLVKVIRFSYVLGLGDKYTSLLSEMASRDEEIEVFDGFERNAVVIDDVLEGIYRLVVNWNDIASSAINFSGNELISRFKITEHFKHYVCINLKFKSVNAPNGFWDVRPKTIKMQSNVFKSLLGREPMSIKQKLQCWSKK